MKPQNLYTTTSAREITAAETFPSLADAARKASGVALIDAVEVEPIGDSGMLRVLSRTRIGEASVVCCALFGRIGALVDRKLEKRADALAETGILDWATRRENGVAV